MRFLLFFSALLLFAQPPNDKGAIEGSVVNGATGTPVKGARVTARGTGEGSAVSDAQGRFLIQSLAPGSYQVRAEHAAYPRPISGLPPRMESIAVGPGETKHDVVVRLTPAGAVSGRVTDADGDPLRNCHVQLLSPLYQRGKRTFFPGSTAMTNDRGEYRVFQVPASDYLVSVRCRGAVPEAKPLTPSNATPGPGLAYAEQFYPGSGDMSSASPVTVAPGADVQGIDFRIPAVRVVPVRGAVSGPADALGQGLFLLLYPEDQALQYMGPLGTVSPAPSAGGQWIFPGVPSGNYEIQAVANKPQRRYFAKQRITVGETPVEGVALELTAGADLAGTVRVEQGQDSTASEVPLQLSLLSLDSGMMNLAAYAQVQKDGHFQLTGVLPGEWEIVLHGGRPLYIKSATLGGQSVSPYRMPVTGVAGSLDIVASAKTGRLEGAVEGGAALIVLLPDGDAAQATSLRRFAFPDAQGRYLIHNVAPGSYKLAAIAGIDPSFSENPSVVEWIHKNGESFSIQEGENANKPLKAVSIGR